MAAALIVLSAFMASVSQVMLKKSSLKQYQSLYKEYINPLVISSYGLLFLTTLINMQAYVWLTYKIGAALSTSTYVFVILWSRLLFRERFARRKLVGIVLILFGIFIIVVGS